MLVASDFDGTLAKIVPQPEDAALLPGALEALSALAQRSDFRVAIVSGRALSDLRARCDVPGCWYVGGHGNETHSPQGDDLGPEPMPPGHHVELRRKLEQIAAELYQQLQAWPGARLEAKPYSVAVHFRQAPQWADAIHLTFSTLAAQGEFRVMMGRQVIELLPENALTKGHAVQRLRSRLDCDLAFYFGDDVTDEDVFRLGEDRVIGVKVAHREGGGAATAASFGLASPEAVLEALRELAAAKPQPKKVLRFSANQP